MQGSERKRKGEKVRKREGEGERETVRKRKREREKERTRENEKERKRKRGRKKATVLDLGTDGVSCASMSIPHHGCLEQPVHDDVSIAPGTRTDGYENGAGCNGGSDEQEERGE